MPPTVTRRRTPGRHDLGVAQVGQTLSASSGAWSGTAPISYDYQWLRCDAAGGNCVDIAGATASTRTLIADSLGSTLRIRVTAANSGGSLAAVSPNKARSRQRRPPPQRLPSTPARRRSRGPRRSGRR